jgi:Holliday junction DNA helicase RuvA
MIARLVGQVVARDGGRVVLDVRDVGYAVIGPVRDADAWASASGPVTVWVHTDVREDGIVLYGFSDDLDRVTFERLREVEGIGPKVALAVLDALGREGLARALATDDLTALCRAPGVGKKLAQRMVLELKGKLPASFGVPVVDGPAAPVAPAAPAEADALELALGKLGYTRAEIGRAVAAVAAAGLADAPVAERLRAALQGLARGR